jgi:hypothetical protein
LLLLLLLPLQEHGPKRLKAALSCANDPGFIHDHLLPFLALLGCDELGRGTYKQPLISLLEIIYQVNTSATATVYVVDVTGNRKLAAQWLCSCTAACL